MAALKYWVWLAALPGVGSRVKLRLLEHFSSPEEVYYAQPEELLLTGAVDKLQAKLLADKSLTRAEDVPVHRHHGRHHLPRPPAGHLRPASAAVRQGLYAHLR